MIPRILFVHDYPTKFVEIDRALLQERYRVHEWYQKSRVVNLPALVHAVASSDIVFGWFASWHTFFPVVLARICKRPSIVVVGGHDTAKMPEIGYGNQRGGLKGWITHRVMCTANQLVVNSFYIRDEIMQNAQIESNRIAVIYHGLPSCELSDEMKRDLVVSVGYINRENLKRKGLESFVRAAAFLPDLPFVVIGARRDDALDYLKSIATPNVQFTGWVSDVQLRDYFSRARVYVQASRHEGFGLALAEAMLYGCIPVVTRIGALPEVVGEAGIYVDSPEPAVIAEGIRHAMACDETWSRLARERIVREFPLERRRDGLYAVVDKELNRYA